jgi:nitroimidazol reductase NimA-like FMN-containing flavoprotein (pyridoxamine 5'-phosphate oxidase superfamily)
MIDFTPSADKSKSTEQAKDETMKEASSKKEYWDALTRLMASQNLAVLATHDHGQPYTSLVAFAGSKDLKSLFFITGRATRKYANLKADPRAAMMIDNRSNAPADIADAMAATASGFVDIISENEGAELLNRYLQKHPHLAEFARSPSTRLIRLNVHCYYVVNRFQNVVELHMRTQC